MSLNRITIKFFVEERDFEITAVVPVFHQWIRDDAVPGLLIDVADYKHVPDGPGIILIGHEADYALDLSHGRAGFLTRLKHLPVGTLAENLAYALNTAVTAARQFAEDTNLTLRPDELEIAFPDRLNAPNTAETWAAFQPDVLAALQADYGNVAIELSDGSVDGRRPLTFHAAIMDVPVLSGVQ